MLFFVHDYIKFGDPFLSITVTTTACPLGGATIQAVKVPLLGVTHESLQPPRLVLTNIIKEVKIRPDVTHVTLGVSETCDSSTLLLLDRTFMAPANFAV